jgi:hypothetical protein
MKEERIPGERERDTLVPLSHPFGEELQGSDLANTMDERTRREHELEGGGDPGQRPKGKGQREGQR